MNDRRAVQLVADLDSVALDHVPDDAPSSKAAAASVDDDSDKSEINHSKTDEN